MDAEQYYQSIQRDLPEDHATLQGWKQEKRNDNEWGTEEDLLWEDTWKSTTDAFLEAAAETYPRPPGDTRHGLHALLAFHSWKHRHTITLHPLDHNPHRWTPEDDATAAITVQQSPENPEEYHITWNDPAPHPPASPTLPDVFATISAELQEAKGPQQLDKEMPQAPSPPTTQGQPRTEPPTQPITTMELPPQHRTTLDRNGFRDLPREWAVHNGTLRWDEITPGLRAIRLHSITEPTTTWALPTDRHQLLLTVQGDATITPTEGDPVTAAPAHAVHIPPQASSAPMTVHPGPTPWQAIVITYPAPNDHTHTWQQRWEDIWGDLLQEHLGLTRTHHTLHPIRGVGQAPHGIHAPGVWAYTTPINPQAAEDIKTALSIQQAQIQTPHRNTQRGYTIWWAYQDHDTLTPQPGAPPLDTNTTALLQAATAAATQVGAPETLGPQYLVETKVAPHAKAQDEPPTPKPLHPPLKLEPTEHTPQDEWATHYIIPHTTTRKNDAAKITVTRHLPHTTQVYELTAPNVLVTRRRHDERYTIQAEGAAATTLYTWATRGDLPHPNLHHAPSWPTPFHTADRPNKKPKHTGVHTPAQEAQHRHDARRKARTLQDDHTIPRISAPPARVSDTTHNRTITGITTDCLNPAASRADAVWISEGRSHTRAVARLHNIQPHKLQRAVGPFAVHVTPYGIDHPRCEHHDPPCSTPCTSPLRQPLPAPTITGNMYLGTVPGDPGIYILPNRSREHAIPLHGVESLALGPPPPKHQHQHIPGDKRTQAPDGGKKAQQRALAHITVHPAAHLPKDFGTERHIVLEGQAHHIITAALYTLAAHERHWDPTTIPAMPPPPQGPKDPVTPFHSDQLLSRRAAPHLHPSKIATAIASWDTLDTPPQQPAIHILKADAQWWVLHWAHGVLMAAEAYTPEIDPEDPPRGQQRLLQATTLTGREGAPWEALHTALYWAQGSPNGPDTPEPTEAWVMQAKAMRNYHLHHPFDDSPAALPWPTDPPETVRKLADIIRSHAKAKMQTPAEPPLRDPDQQATHPLFKPHAPPAPLPPVPPKGARRQRGAPAPNQAGKAATPRPPASHPTHPANPDQASSSSALPPLPPPHPDQASSSSSLPSLPPHHSDQASSSCSLPPPAPPPPKAYPGFQKGAKVQQPFLNDHTGDSIWCEGTIQYRLKAPGDNKGPQIRVIWHRQKELDQGSSAPDKPVSYTLELTSAHPIRLRTEENKAHTGTKYTGELPPEWSQGLPPPRLPKRPPTGKKSPSPIPPP